MVVFHVSFPCMYPALAPWEDNRLQEETMVQSYADMIGWCDIPDMDEEAIKEAIATLPDSTLAACVVQWSEQGNFEQELGSVAENEELDDDDDDSADVVRFLERPNWRELTRERIWGAFQALKDQEDFHEESMYGLAFCSACEISLEENPALAIQTAIVRASGIGQKDYEEQRRSQQLRRRCCSF